jgi:hypothetical protein
MWVGAECSMIDLWWCWDIVAEAAQWQGSAMYACEEDDGGR